MINYFCNILITSLLFLGASTSLQAEFLQFVPGNSASYELHQTVSHKVDLMGVITNVDIDATIALDVKILEASETLSYPFTVEVTLRNLQFATVESSGRNYKANNFASEEEDSTLPALSEFLPNIIDVPMTFIVNGPFDVVETSGVIDQLDPLYTQEILSVKIFGLTPWTYNLFLTQLFHLAGEDLELSNSYEVEGHQLFNWEDGVVNEDEVDIVQFFTYDILKMDNENIDATWKGSAILFNKSVFAGLPGQLGVEAQVSWNKNNPLIQQRKMKLDLNEKITFLGLFEMAVQMNIEQTWQAQ